MIQVMALQELMAQAALLHRNGRLQEAEALYRQAVGLNPEHAEAWHRLGLVTQGLLRLDEAANCIEQAIRLDDQRAIYFLNLGLLYQDSGKLDDAESSFRRALDLDHSFAAVHNQLGLLLHEKGRFNEAGACFSNAIHYKPDYAAACNNLGSNLRSLGDYAGAGQLFEQATRLKPDYALAYYNLGANCMDMGQLLPAEINLKHAIQLKPDYVQAYYLLGHAQHLLGKLDEAQISFTRAAQMRPGKNGAELDSLAQIFWEQGNIEQACASYRQAQTLAPHNLKSMLGALLSLPAVYRDTDDLFTVRKRYANGLKTLHENIPSIIAHNQPDKLLDDLRWSNFYLAYQGLDDKLLQVGYAHFVASTLEKVAPQFMQSLEKKDVGRKRLRIGYLSSFFRESTVGWYFASWISRINRNQFETFVYHTRPEKDHVTHEIANACDHFRHLVGRYSLPLNVAAEVLRDDLDILVYPELGMDATNFLLAAMRLAPVQCASWGHPVTSGHANIDYYFSSAAMEPDNAAAHYSERLVLLDGIGTCYSKPVLPAAKRRADFALPEGKTLYLCPQSLFKIHPDNDALLARVLERDPNGVLVLFAGRHPHITKLLLDRLTQALRERGIVPQNRGVVLPSVAHDDYLCINMLCDVMLDTVHWSGGNTSLDAIACNLPLVTLPGEFMRGRQSYGMLKLMGLVELIAKDQDDYVEIAVRLGTDKTWREQVAKHISATNHVLFDNQLALRQLEQFFISVSA